MSVELTDLRPGTRVVLAATPFRAAEERIVLYRHGDGAVTTGPAGTTGTDYVTLDAIDHVAGMLDTSTWRELAPGEVVLTGGLCLAEDGRMSRTDAAARRGSQYRCSVEAGWFEWPGLRFDPSHIMTPPCAPGAVVHTNGTYRQVRNVEWSRDGWRVYFTRGATITTNNPLELAPEGTTVCMHCAEVHMADDPPWPMPGVCPECASDYHPCGRCGESTHANNTREMADGDHWCRTCVVHYASACAVCGELFPDDELSEGMCYTCAHEDVECHECGQVTERQYAGDWEEDDGEWTCDECRSARDTIHYYSWRPRPQFHGDGPVFYGVELEVDGAGESGNKAARIMAGNDLWYAKHDGSLTRGFEVVSHPASLRYHLNEAGWPGLLNRARREGYTSHDARTCGLHVHISRDVFRDEHGEEDAALARLLLIFDMHWSKLLRFSRRTQAQCDDWAQRYSMTRPHNDTEAARACREFKNENGGSRYYAVNLQNDNTVELRLFRGTLNEETFFATLEMCDALRRIATETTTAELVGLTWSAMRRRWFNTYDHLPGYLDRRFEDEPQVEEEDEELPEDEVLPDGDEAPPDEVLPDGDEAPTEPDDDDGVIIVGEGATIADGTAWVRCTEIPEPGTRVRIRQWDDMVAEYGANVGLGVATPGALFHRDMRPMCGNVYTVPQCHGHNSFSTGGWTITPEMIERAATWQRCAEMPAPGTPIRIRQWDDMAAEFGVSDAGTSIRCAAEFLYGMRGLCGDVFPAPYLRTDSGYASYRGWSISPDMIECAV